MFWGIRGCSCFRRLARLGRSENIFILGTPFGVSAGFASRAFRQYIFSASLQNDPEPTGPRMKVWDLSPNFHRLSGTAVRLSIDSCDTSRMPPSIFKIRGVA